MDKTDLRQASSPVHGGWSFGATPEGVSQFGLDQKVDKRVSCDKLARVFCAVDGLKSRVGLDADTRNRDDSGFVCSDAAAVVASEPWASAAVAAAG